MYTFMIKLIFIWILFIIGTYIFWIFSYFVLVKFALGEINEFNFTDGSIYKHISLSHIFWYLVYVGGIALCMFMMKQLVVRAPNPKLAATIYTVLITISAVVMIKALAQTANISHIMPHIFINACFLIAIIVSCLKLNPQH